MSGSLLYITPFNRASIRPPYVGLNALLQGGWLKGNRGALQSLLDRSLNLVSPKTHRFVTPISSVLYTGLFIEEMYSEHPLDRAFGSIPEMDLSFWILTYGGRLGDEGNWKLRWFPTYMFVNDFGAVIGGRERYGFPKVHAQIDRETEARDDFAVTVTARAMKQKGRSQKLEYMKIFQIYHSEADDETGIDGLMERWRDEVLDEGLELTADLSGLGLPQVDFPVVLALQLADPTNPNLASVQELIEVPQRNLQLHDAGWVGEISVKFEEPQTAMIAAEHGIEPETQMTGCLWVQQDFRTELATRIDDSPVHSTPALTMATS